MQKEYHLPPGDFPDPERFRNILEGFDISSFPKLDKKMVKTIDEASGPPPLTRISPPPHCLHVRLMGRAEPSCGLWSALTGSQCRHSRAREAI